MNLLARINRTLYQSPMYVISPLVSVRYLSLCINLPAQKADFKEISTVIQKHFYNSCPTSACLLRSVTLLPTDAT